jgi:retron-type reverse transcriptase
LSRTIKDGRVISLIHKYLRAGVVVKHRFEETEVGVPQGGNLSPILSNLDQEKQPKIAVDHL